MRPAFSGLCSPPLALWCLLLQTFPGPSTQRLASSSLHHGLHVVVVIGCLSGSRAGCFLSS